VGNVESMENIRNPYNNLARKLEESILRRSRSKQKDNNKLEFKYGKCM
jgi:hypothetical protein